MRELPPKVRLFVAVEVAAQVRDKLRQTQRQLREASDDGIRWTPSEQIHLTLRFFGDVASMQLGDIEAALRRACGGRQAFELRAVGMGAFPDLRRPKVIWAAVQGKVEALISLQKEILRETSAWGQMDAREFSPHLTLGRVRDGRHIGAVGEKLREFDNTDFGNWRVSEVRMMQSELAAEGARHSELAVVRLGS